MVYGWLVALSSNPLVYIKSPSSPPDTHTHSPPCDGHCPLLARPLPEYAATLIMYPKTPPATAKKNPTPPAGGGEEKNEVTKARVRGAVSYLGRCYS